MCAPVSVTVSSGLNLTPVIPHIIGIVCLAIGAVWAFITRKPKKE